jgi:hypothetical protein
VTSRHSRRAVLGLAARGASVLAMTAAGLAPDLSAGPGTTDPQQIVRGRQFILTRSKGAARAARIAAARQGADGRIAAAFLAREGFASDELDGDVADLAWSDGEHVGRLDVVVFRDERRDRYARLIRQDTARGSLTGVSIWDGAHPERRTTFELRGSAMRKTADLTRLADGSVLIEAVDGRRAIVPPRPDRSAGAKGPGLASVQAVTICTTLCEWQCTFVCDWVCTTILVETCVISAVCGPLAVVCAGFCVVAVIASCAYNCTNYCGWACSTTCTFLEG